MITIAINGIEYGLFESATATKQFDAASGGFSIQAVATAGKPLPIRVGDKCEIFASGNKIINGFVEALDGSYSADSHTLTVSGRDKTADLIDSTLAGGQFDPPLTLRLVIQILIKQLGIDVKVIDKANFPVFNSAEDLPSPKIGDNAFQFIEGLARKRQVLVSVDGDGNLVLTRGGGKATKAEIRNILDNDTNNVLSSSFTFDYSKRFSKYQVVSQLSQTAANNAGVVPATDLVSQKSEIVPDPQIRASRQLIFQAETLSSKEQGKLRAQWEANVRKTRGNVYTCAIQDYFVDGVFVQPGLIMKIIDNFAAINTNMLLNSVQYNFSLLEGATAVLTFIEQEAYTLALAEPGDLGDQFVG